MCFKVGLSPSTETEPLSVRFSRLASGKNSIPATAIRCLSLGGIGVDGREFAKSIRVPANGVQILWCGIDIPVSADGKYQGHLEIRAGSTVLGKVDIALTVEGSVLTDQGDSVAKNLSRLRWLDSNVGREPTITDPFIPLKAKKRTIRILGREVVLGNDGLPAEITSFFNESNTAITDSGRPIIAAPFSFIVETESGAVNWKSRFAKLKHTELEASWTAKSRADGMKLDLKGRLDYTGSGEIHIKLTARRDMALKDIRLDVPWVEDSAVYFMGLNRRGGRRLNEPLAWKWDVSKRQDCLWMGDVNAGMMLRFKEEAFVRPLVNIYYNFLPLNLPKSWGNGDKGGINVGAVANGIVPVSAYGGSRNLKAGDQLHFIAEFYITPFRKLDTEKQWTVRFLHPHSVRNKDYLRKVVDGMDPAKGANALNIHHANAAYPYINYPYADDTVSELKYLLEKTHKKGIQTRAYYTTREITNNFPELHALHSMNGEVIFPGPGKDARTHIHRNGPHKWLVDNLGDNFIPAWVDHLNLPQAEWDLSVITQPDSRWDNYYLEGLRWLVDKVGVDGIYIDDTALSADSLRRARRILDKKPGRLIDFHTWNHFNGYAGYANNLTIYMELLPYIDRLWIGEGFNCNNVSCDYWLVEMSGLPFGLMSEMLDGANPWRGLVFGETARKGWSGDPSAIWKIWDEFEIQGSDFIPFFVKDSPVRSDSDDVPVTVYRGDDRTFLAIASWAKEQKDIRLTVDWKALGLDPSKANFYAPPIRGFQVESIWADGDPIPIDPGRGLFLVVDEIKRKVTNPAKLADMLMRIFQEFFTTPTLDADWSVVKSSSGGVSVEAYAGALRITAPANLYGGIERKLPKAVRAVQLELDPGNDRGQTWGPGVALVWANGRVAKINLRLEDKKFGVIAGEGLRITGGPVSNGSPVTVRILLDDQNVYFQKKTVSSWRTIDVQSRNGLEGDPISLRIGKMQEHGRWENFTGVNGIKGESSYRNISVFVK